MAIAQRPRIGLKDVKYAVYNESTSTYGTITALTNAIELSYDPASSISTLFADDGAAFAAETVGESTIALGVADLLPTEIAALLGHSYANGIIQYASNDQSAIVALGGKMLRAGKNGSDDVYEYFWLPRVKFSKPSMTSTTKGGTIEFQTPTMEGRVLQNSSGVYKTSVRTDDANALAATLSGWFSSVVQSTGANLTAVTFDSVAGDASDNTITLTFAKGGASFSLATLEDYAVTVSVVSTGALIAGTSTYAYSAAGTSPTITITNANVEEVAYLVTVSNRVRDINGVAVTPASKLVTPAA